MARLFVLSGASIGATHDLEATTVLGRGVDADVVISEPSISRRHARLIPAPEPGVWKIRDLESSNGVHVGGKRVKEAVIRHGDTFSLGDVEFRLRDEPGAEGSDELPAATAAPELEFEDEIELPGASTRPAPAFKPERPMAVPEDQERLRASRERAARERAAGERAARRAAALEGPGRAARPKAGGSSAGSGGQVLQYAQHRRGDDLGQLPGWKRALFVLVAVGLAAGVAYGAFELTRTARARSAAIGD
jgi:hypothetical protein